MDFWRGRLRERAPFLYGSIMLYYIAVQHLVGEGVASANAALFQKCRGSV
jgi:hypothetical protein